MPATVQVLEPKGREPVQRARERDHAAQHPVLQWWHEPLEVDELDGHQVRRRETAAYAKTPMLLHRVVPQS